MSRAMNADTIRDIDAFTEHKPLFRNESVTNPLRGLFKRTGGTATPRALWPEASTKAPTDMVSITRPIFPPVEVEVVIATLEGARADAGSGAVEPAADDTFDDSAPTRIISEPVPQTMADAGDDAVHTVPVFAVPVFAERAEHTAAVLEPAAVPTPAIDAAEPAVASFDAPPSQDTTEARLIAIEDAPTQIVSGAIDPAAVAAFARALDEAPSARGDEDAVVLGGDQPTLLLLAPGTAPATEAGYSWRDAIPAEEGEPVSIPKHAYAPAAAEDGASGVAAAAHSDPWALECDDTPIAPEVRHLLDADVRPVELVPEFVAKPSLATRMMRFIGRPVRRFRDMTPRLGRAVKSSRTAASGLTLKVSDGLRAAGTFAAARRTFLIRSGAVIAVAASALISAYALDLSGPTKIETWAEVKSAVQVLNAAAPVDVNDSVTLERVSADEASRTMTYHMAGAVETLDDNVFDPAQMKAREIAGGCGAYRPYLAGIVEQLRFVYSARDGSTGVFTILPGDCGIEG